MYHCGGSVSLRIAFQDHSLSLTTLQSKGQHEHYFEEPRLYLQECNDVEE